MEIRIIGSDHKKIEKRRKLAFSKLNPSRI
jgi:hypothetical protein